MTESQHLLLAFQLVLSELLVGRKCGYYNTLQDWVVLVGEREARENSRSDLSNKGLACGEVTFFIRK